MRQLKPFESKIYLSSPTMHGEELQFVQEAYDTNWMSTVGANIDVIEQEIAAYIGVNHAVALSSGTAALHLAVKLAGIHQGDEVLCSDLTFSATVNPVIYEGGIPVFVDSEPDTWNLDPVALEKAFELHPNAKAVMIAHLYGTPARINEVVSIAHAHGALVIEDAAESLGATISGKQTGSFGDIAAISFNGNKIITGSTGGMLLTNSGEQANKARKWSTQSREAAPWYQHEELGYNYRMSNVVAGVVRGQFLHLEEHIVQKKAICERYAEGLAGLPVNVMPFCHPDVPSCHPEERSGGGSPRSAQSPITPNYWLSCLIIDEDAMCSQVRGDYDYLYTPEPNTFCPQQILDAIAALNAEGRPIWKPMHLQPYYRNLPFVTAQGDGRACTSAYFARATVDVSADIFQRGLCLPSDNKMTPEQQDRIIAAIKLCF